MAATANTSTSSDINVALDQELISNYKGDFDRLSELLGLFGVETVAAGTALYQSKIDVTLNNSKTDGSSSGTAYVEGDEVALSKATAKKVPVGAISIYPYRKRTTAAAIAQSGYETAVYRTDQKLLAAVRSDVISEFISFLDKGTGTATGETLQHALAVAAATLENTLETNNDEGGNVIHFVNRMDVADYLGKANVSTQTLYGLTYLEDFLGIPNVFLTNRVASGSIYTTTSENIHAYAADFSALAQAELAYATDDSGVIGVAHAPAYDHVSAETHVLSGLLLFPENTDYIIKGTITPKE